MRNPTIPDEQPPAMLFHYTTAEALLSILKSKTVRATALGWVNDTSELALAAETLQALLRERAKRVAPPIAKVLLGLADNFHLETRLDRDPDAEEPVTACAFSLSTEENDLNQWRAYCPQGGYALGFTTERLQAASAVGLTRAQFRLLRCRYTEVEQRELLGSLVDDIVADEPTASVNLAQALWNAFLRVAPLIKHPAFRHENEWRLVCDKVRIKELSLRATKSYIMPFVPLTLEGLFIDKIIVGPQLDQRMGVQGAAAAFRQTFNISTKVIRSEIPYRLLR